MTDAPLGDEYVSADLVELDVQRIDIVDRTLDVVRTLALVVIAVALVIIA